MAGLNKPVDTPASIIEKVAVSSNCRPDYTAVDIEGPSHDPRFTMALKMLGMTTKATSSTKKEAKQMCAHKMLQKIEVAKDLPEIPNLELIMAAWNRNQFPSEKLNSLSNAGAGDQPQSAWDEAKLISNAIGKLTEFCSKLKLAQPHFQDEEDIKNTDNTHLFVVSCTLYHVTKERPITRVDGKGDRKKKAKQEAAENMIRLLKNELNIDVTDVPENREKRLAVAEAGRRAQKEHDEDRSGALDSEIIINNEPNGCRLDAEDDGLRVSPNAKSPDPDNKDANNSDSNDDSGKLQSLPMRAFSITPDTDPVARCFNELSMIPEPHLSNVNDYLMRVSDLLQMVGFRLHVEDPFGNVQSSSPLKKSTPEMRVYLHLREKTSLTGFNWNGYEPPRITSYGIGPNDTMAKLDALRRFRQILPAALVQLELDNQNDQIL